MRDQKFRAYEPDSKTFVYFDLNSLNDGMFGRHGIVENTSLKEWQEYTGLKDKNGVEIYEGDVFNEYVGSNDFPEHKNMVIEMAFGQWGYYEPHYKVGKNWEGTYMERECSKVSGKIGYIWNPLIRFPMTEGVILAENPKKIESIDIEVIGNIYQNPELLK